MTSGFSQKLVTSQLKPETSVFPRITINQRFTICALLSHHTDYNTYKGIDVAKEKWIHIYVKLKNSNYPFSKNLTESLRNQICPKLVETGEMEISNWKYMFEVHEQYGPSLQSMFKQVKRPPKAKELVHLLLQMIKLIEKIDNIKYLSGELEPKSIVFDLNPRKNELYILNSFSLKRKTFDKKVSQTKYSSRGVHLGRKISIKDDLESVCYILIDIFTQGEFIRNRLLRQCEELKLSLKIQDFAKGLPQIFIDFYYYVINLNYEDEINFYYWKSYLSKFLTPEVVAHPYGFLMSKNDPQEQSDPEQSEISDLIETFQDHQNTKQEQFKKVHRTISTNMKIK